ncbi:MAG: hypothetical protein OXG04_19095 [Acidobacteria bacterium]|nr:hypothetical protein [Acidobacteriota bacterium]
MLAWRWCERAGVLDAPLKELRSLNPPFRTYGLPWRWARVAQLRSQSPRESVAPARLF